MYFVINTAINLLSSNNITISSFHKHILCWFPPPKNLHLTSLYNRIKTYPRCICSNISHIAGHTSIDSWYTIWFILSADKPACTVVVCTPTSLPGITTCVKFRENYLPRHLVQKLAGINQRKGCTCTRNTELEWLEEWMKKGFIWGFF